MFETSYTAGGRLDAPHYPTYRVPYIVGLHEVVANASTKTLEYEVPFNGELYAVSIDASLYENDDCWSMTVAGDKICDNIYVKRAPEGVNLMAFIPVVAGNKIKIDFTNVGGEKTVWASLHFLKDGDLTKKPGGLSPITVNKSVVRIYLIDDGDEDGDILSVFLNGALVKSKHLLRHDAPGGGVNGTNYIEVPLQLGDNEFVFQGESPGAVNSYLTAKFRVTDSEGNVLYNTDQLPNLRMTNEGTTGVKGDNWYLDPKPKVSWIVNRTV